MGFKSDWPIFKCVCGVETIYPICEVCGEKTKRFHYCRECREAKEGICDVHDSDKSFSYSNRKIDSKYYFNGARDLLGYKS